MGGLSPEHAIEVGAEVRLRHGVQGVTAQVRAYEEFPPWLTVDVATYTATGLRVGIDDPETAEALAAALSWAAAELRRARDTGRDAQPARRVFAPHPTPDHDEATASGDRAAGGAGS